jgi:hypothetical protein
MNDTLRRRFSAELRQRLVGLWEIKNTLSRLMAALSNDGCGAIET